LRAVDDLFPAAPRRGNGGSGTGGNAVRASRAGGNRGRAEAAGDIDLRLKRGTFTEIVRKQVSVVAVIRRQAITVGRIDRMCTQGLRRGPALRREQQEPPCRTRPSRHQGRTSVSNTVAEEAEVAAPHFNAPSRRQVSQSSRYGRGVRDVCRVDPRSEVGRRPGRRCSQPGGSVAAWRVLPGGPSSRGRTTR
jgi:hypothetical protein